MYNFNRPPFPSVNPMMTPVPGYSPHNSTPRSPFLCQPRLPPPQGITPDPAFLSPRGDSYSFGSPRFPNSGPYHSPFHSATSIPPPFPWSPTAQSPFTPRFNSSASQNSSAYVYRTASPQSRNDLGSSYCYDSSPSNYVSGREQVNSGNSLQTTFGSTRSNHTSFRGRGASYSSAPRWKRGDPITRSLSDPWADLTPVRTPEAGGCLVANPLVQRHTVLFAPREQRRRKATDAALDDPDQEGAPEPKRLSSPSLLDSTSPA